MQSRLVRCIGSEVDNIRPAQRALQLFKNKHLLTLIMGSDTSSAANTNTSISAQSMSTSAISSPVPLLKGVDDSRGNNDNSVVMHRLSRLLPALFRGGSMSWNPTVNKMTGLALNNLKVCSSLHPNTDTVLIISVILCQLLLYHIVTSLTIGDGSRPV